MAALASFDITMLEGAPALLASHASELPQRDDLCGAFCGALALRAAGIEEHDGEPVDQDLVARAAGSLVSRLRDTASLPAGERGRRDYRLTPPFVDRHDVSGTTAGGLIEAIDRISGGRLVAIPLGGPWSAQTLRDVFDVAGALAHPVTLVANLATRHLWGGRPRPDQLLRYMLDGDPSGPAADWDVGHFACIVGRASGPGGSLYVLADTYPSLGSAGVHLQPQECLAVALARPDMPPGGLIVVTSAADAEVVRSGAAELGLAEAAWDNGTITQATLR